MDNEGILIEVNLGLVTRVLTNGTPLPAGAAVTYDGAETRLVPVREPSNEEQIERISAALREGRANTQRHGIRVACQAARKHYQAIAQATGALANLLADLNRINDEEPAALVTRIQEAANRIDDDVLAEVRQQLLVTCAEAMELRFAADAHERQPVVANGVLPVRDVPREPPREPSREMPPEPPRRLAFPR